MIVSRSHDDIQFSCLRVFLRRQVLLGQSADTLDIVGKEPDGIDAAQNQGLSARAECDTPRVKKVVDAGSYAVVTETGHVHRTVLLKVRSQPHAGRAGANLGPTDLSPERNRAGREKEEPHARPSQTHHAAAGCSLMISSSRKWMPLVRPSFGERMLSSCSIDKT